MQFDLNSLLAQALEPDNLSHAGSVAFGFVGSCLIQFVKRRRRCLHLHPRRARQQFRRQARRLVIAAYLAGHRPSICFWLACRFQLASVQHVVVNAKRLANPAEPVVAAARGKAIFRMVCDESDGNYFSADATLVREKLILGRILLQIPNAMLVLNQLAGFSQEIYEGLASQHAELVLDEFRGSRDCLASEIRDRDKSLRRLLSCLRQELTRILDELRQDIRIVVQFHRPRLGSSATPASVMTSQVSQAACIANSHASAPKWLRTAFIGAVLGFLVLAGLQIATLVLLGR